MARRATDNPNWGGRRSGAGRPRKYVRIPLGHYIQRSDLERVTEVSDLDICLAESEVDEDVTDRGILIGDIWYGANESLAIAEFIQRYSSWLRTGNE